MEPGETGRKGRLSPSFSSLSVTKAGGEAVKRGLDSVAVSAAAC